MIELYGTLHSPRVMAVRLSLAEKQLPHHFKQPASFGSDEYRRLNPFGQYPTLVDGGIVVIETLAILYYLEESHCAGYARLDTVSRCRHLQWATAVCWSDTNPLAEVLQPLRQRVTGKPSAPPAADVAERCQRYLDILSGGLDDQPFFTGQHPGIPDFLFFPIVYYLPKVPLGQRLLDAAPTIHAWKQRLENRPAYFKIFSGA